MYGRDGYDYDGYRLRVEFPRSGRGTGRGGGGGGGGGAPRGRYGPPSRRSENRVVVSGELTVPCGLMSLLDRYHTLNFPCMTSLTNASFHARS